MHVDPVLGVVLAISVSLAACSGGSPSEPVDEQVMTEAEFVDRATQICTSSTDAAGELLPTEAMTPDEVAGALAALADVTEEGIDSLAEIQPPSQEETYEEWLDALGRSAAAVRDAAIALRLGDNAALADRLELAEAHSLRAVDLAADLGLISCQFGAPVEPEP